MSVVSAGLTRFDRWADAGPLTPRDLGVYRIVFALLMLPRVLPFRQVDAFPDSFYAPPPGPLMLFPGLPPDGVMVGVEIALSILLVALALGWRTTAVSWSATVLMLYGYGTSYSLGKIDHTIFLVILPAALSLARWGDAVSVDAVLRRGRARSGSRVGPRATPQWPMRLFALLIGLGFVTAGVPKVLSGWLDPSSQAVQTLINREYYVNGRTEWLAPFALDVRSPLLWELADVATVVLELAFVLAVVNWRAFRIVLAAATLFHLGVLLTMNIFFVANVLVYGAFVSWSALGGSRSAGAERRGPLDRLAQRAGSWPVELGAATLAVLGGLGIWALRQSVSIPSTSWLILVAGAAVGVWYLCRQALAVLAWRGRRGRAIDLREPSTTAVGARSGSGERVAAVRDRPRS